MEKPVLGFGFSVLARKRPPSRPPPRLQRRIKAGNVFPPKRVFDLPNYAEHNGASAEWLAQAELKEGDATRRGGKTTGECLGGRGLGQVAAGLEGKALPRPRVEGERASGWVRSAGCFRWGSGQQRKAEHAELAEGRG